MPRIRRWIGLALAVVGGALLLGWLAWTLDARWSQSRLARRLESVGRPAETPPGLALAAATRHEAGTSGMIGRLEIQRLGLSVMMAEGIDARTLRRGVGHVPGTAFPGERGNVGLAGHRDTYFRRLEHVVRGDLVRLVTPDGEFTYEVDSILVVPPQRGDLLYPTRRADLTLVTCYPFRWVGSAPKRFVVQARMHRG